MSCDVAIKFRKNADYSNENKNKLIFLLPGRYKVSQEDLNGMDQLKIHIFKFDNLESAKNFVSKVFLANNNIFDVQTINF